MKTSGFCSVHKGKYTDISQIKAYLETIFSPREHKLISINLHDLYTTINPLIINDNDNDGKAKETLDFFFNFLIKICTANRALIYIITKEKRKQMHINDMFMNNKH